MRISDRNAALSIVQKAIKLHMETESKTQSKGEKEGDKDEKNK